jgi:hypothetical protein
MILTFVSFDFFIHFIHRENIVTVLFNNLQIPSLHLSLNFIRMDFNIYEMTTSTKSGSGKKKGSFYKFLAIFVGLAVIGTLVTALVLMFSSFGFGGGDFDMERLQLSTYLLYGVAGSIPLLLMPTLFLWLFSRRKVIMNNVKASFQVRGIGPYASGFKFTGAKKARFCQYCGYEVRTGERECPECSGPVRNVNL